MEYHAIILGIFSPLILILGSTYLYRLPSLIQSVLLEYHQLPEVYCYPRDIKWSAIFHFNDGGKSELAVISSLHFRDLTLPRENQNGFEKYHAG